MIYVTGDCHGEFIRFNKKYFPEQKEMSKEDFVIICGDFGGVWNKDYESKYETVQLDWLESQSFTTLFVSGNHENYDRLDAYPVEEWNGGKIQRIPLGGKRNAGCVRDGGNGNGRRDEEDASRRRVRLQGEVGFAQRGAENFPAPQG